MKIGIFGSGKIGRTGYEVVFVDIDRHIIDLLNQQGQYRVEIKDRQCETLVVKSVRGIHADDISGIKKEISEADLVACLRWHGPWLLPWKVNTG